MRHKIQVQTAVTKCTAGVLVRRAFRRSVTSSAEIRRMPSAKTPCRSDSFAASRRNSYVFCFLYIYIYRGILFVHVQLPIFTGNPLRGHRTFNVLVIGNRVDFDNNLFVNVNFVRSQSKLSCALYRRQHVLINNKNIYHTTRNICLAVRPKLVPVYGICTNGPENTTRTT